MNDHKGIQGFRSLPLCHLRCTLEAVEYFKLPRYKGSTLRGGLGQAISSLTCVFNQQDCPACPVLKTCPYAFLFEGLLPEENTVQQELPLGDHVPKPFVLRPPSSSQCTYKPGETLVFDLLLFGQSIAHLSLFQQAIAAFAEKGIGASRGRLHLKHMHQLIPGQPNVCLYKTNSQLESHEPYFFDLMDLLQSSFMPPEAITFKFKTATRLKMKGHYVGRKEINFDVLFQKISGRFESLALLYGQYKQLPQTLDSFRSNAKNIQTTRNDTEWFDWKRYSNRQKTHMRMGGLVGEIAFAGDFSQFWPYMLLGQYLHVGKGTTFGLGHYEIIA